MHSDQTPFRTGWWAADLGEARPCDSTYCFSDYAALPPLDTTLFDGEFGWLPPLDEQTDRMMAVHREQRSKKLRQRLDTLTAAAAQLGLTLPPAFVRFMASPVLQDRVPSCTACYYDLPERIVKSTASDSGYFLRFLNDQQDVLLWFLYLDTSGNHCVVVSDLMYDDEEGFRQWAEGSQYSMSELTLGHTFFCAPDFESCVYRFWMENTIWFALNEGVGVLDDTQRKYLEHYQK